MIDLNTAKKAELDAELALYKEVNVQIPELKTNKEKVAFITELQKEYGIPSIVTQDDIDSGLLAKEVEVGDMIMTPLDAPEPAPEDGEPKKDEDKEEEEPSATKLNIKVYKGEAVLETKNVIVNGRRYVDVFTTVASYRITPDEFEALVKNV